MKRYIIALLIVNGLVISSGEIQLQTNAYYGKFIQHKETKFFAYAAHDSIVITSDDNFTDYGFSGLGTSGKPYLIENYSIVTANNIGIDIGFTTKHFVIRNCYIVANERAINIEEVDVGTVRILNNICIDNEFIGIRLYICPGAILINNTCINSRDGINVHSSPDVTITNNTCTSNFYYGIKLEHSSGTILTNNTCRNNRFSGIYLWYSTGPVLMNNTCVNSNGNGIRFYNSDSGLLVYNLFQENTEYGMYIEVGSDQNTIHHNTFLDNNIGSNSQALDNGENNLWYDSTIDEGNFWSNFNGTGSYSIAGSALSIDPYPLEDFVNPPVVQEFYLKSTIAFAYIFSIILVQLVLIKRRKSKRNDL